MRPAMQRGVFVRWCRQELPAAIACILLCCSVRADEPVAGHFELTDHRGAAVTEHSYDGKLRLVLFGYTRCPDVCPLTLYEVSRALRDLGSDAAEVQPLFISIDPRHDSPQALADYVAAFGPTFVGLTGTEAQLRSAARSFNVTYGFDTAPDAAPGEGTPFHSTYLFLMGRDGRFLDVIGYGAKAATIAGRVREQL